MHFKASGPSPSDAIWSMTVRAARSDDWKAERDRIELAAVVTRLRGPADKTQGRRLLWRCPFHDDHNPSLQVDTVRQRWDCYPCDLIAKDAADFVMRHEAMTFPEAKAFLTGGAAPTRGARPRPGSAPAKRPPKSAPAPEPKGMPHDAALALVEAAAARLWTAEGRDALAYLTGPKRGLTHETIRAARLGWTPPAEGVPWKAPGVVIPWFDGGRLVMVKVRPLDEYLARLPEGKGPRKYVEAFRDPARLVCYPGPETIRPGRPLIVAEGEFDALCLGQELAHLAAVVTLGGTAEKPGPAFVWKTACASALYLATDADGAGDGAADGWPGRARRVRPPSPFKDWTEAKGGGIDLRRWWSDVLAGNPRPPLFTWPELAAQRWGPGLTDPAPGIVIPAPGAPPAGA